MKVKMAVVQNALPALTDLAGKAVPASAAFKVALVIKALNEPLSVFDETRGKLLREVGEENPEKPGEYKILDIERWKTEMTALLEQEIEVSVTPIRINEFKDVEVEPKTLVALDWCLEA